MLILIAESKTMLREELPVSPQEFKSHTPIYAGKASEIMDSLHGLAVPEIVKVAKGGDSTARNIWNHIQCFNDTKMGFKAVDAFTGVVFKQLHKGDYNMEQKEFLNRNLRIISSLYGWLRPDDIIKSYRFDFNLKLAPGGKSFKQFWKAGCTIALVNQLRETFENEVVDLLPSEASACIDWKMVRSVADVYKVEFKVPSGPSTMKTPHAGRLKELRGRMLDLIIRERISKATELKELEGDDFLPQGELLYPNTFYYFSD